MRHDWLELNIVCMLRKNMQFGKFMRDSCMVVQRTATLAWKSSMFWLRGYSKRDRIARKTKHATDVPMTNLDNYIKPIPKWRAKKLQD
jgi:hypothetical protein